MVMSAYRCPTCMYISGNHGLTNIQHRGPVYSVVLKLYCMYLNCIYFPVGKMVIHSNAKMQYS